MRCAITEQSRGVRGHPPPENFEFYIARDANFLGTQINIKSSRLGYCMHTNYTNRGGSLNVWGRSWGVWGGSFPPAPPLDRTLTAGYRGHTVM